MNRSTSIYQDIAARTGGSIYIGVVGPVRTGKSTFIKRFMETQVLPHIDNTYRRDRAQDELPQSGSGRTIMTAEPKFVPEEAVRIHLEDDVTFAVRLIDCVGYMVPGAVGQFEELSPRMVMTPWYDHEIPMTEAAELGTRKVIADHSTVGVVVTTDGTITDIPREDYLEAEERVIRELQPRWVLGENVAGFLRMGLDKTLIDLEQAGYDVRVFVLPAAAVGAWHERKRVFIIGSAASHAPCQRHRGCGQGAGHPNLCEWQLPQDEQGWQGVDGAAFPCGLPDDPHHAGKALPQPGLGRVADGFPAQMDGHSLWAEEPADIPRLTEDVPNRSKRMKTLGNAVSPPQVFPILKYIADIETGRCPMGGEEL